MRYALRSMRKSPGFASVAVLTLALGIGANTAIFSVVSALLLRPLPVHKPESLLVLSNSNARRGMTGVPFSLSTFETVRDQNQSFSGVSAYCNESFTLTGTDHPELLVSARVAPNYFDVLGVPPALGRGFLAEEGQPGAKPVVVISTGLWQRRFGGNRSILGTSINLSQHPYTIVGVMPAGFAFPYAGVDVWVSKLTEYSGFHPEQLRTGAGFLYPIARLKPGVSSRQAETELALLDQRIHEDRPGNPSTDPDAHVDAVQIQESLVSGIRPTLLVLSAAVGVVLLIACANVASLMMARATGRAREIALRAALGASRGIIVRHLLAESLVLAIAGAALGIALAQSGVAWLSRSTGPNLAGADTVRLDLPVLAFAVAISLATGLAFGLAPALQASRPDLNGVLRDSGWGTTGGARRHRARAILVASQIALSIVLLIGAGLLIESFRRLQTVDAGFRPQHAMKITLNLPPTKYPDDMRRSEFLHQAIDRIQALPGVESASASLGLPLAATVMAPVLGDSQPVVPAGQRPLATWNAVTPGYFRSLGTSLLAGRDFTWADDAKAPKVAIISQKMASNLFGADNPIGRHFIYSLRNVTVEVIGVAADVKSRGLAADSGMTLYTSYAQYSWARVNLAVRVSGDPVSVMKSAPSQIYALDSDQPVVGVQTLEDYLASTLAQRRQTMELIAGFAAIALLLAIIGLYGVMAYSVSQRTMEIGIRRAIGAQTSDVLLMVLRQGLVLSLAGIVLGVGVAFGLTRLISGMLFNVKAADPWTFAGISGLFLVVSLVASCVPAWTATRVDPLKALRR
jgi:putative ABC transport system permease protein